LGVPLGSLSFISFFFQDVLDNDVQHIDALLSGGCAGGIWDFHSWFHAEVLLPFSFFPYIARFSMPVSLL
jgi:hypothetical protein